MKYQIGILDSDVGYSMALMEYINMRAKVPLAVNVFTELEKLQEFIKYQSLELLLIDEEKKNMELPCKCLILAKQKMDLQDNRVDNGTTKQIYRYQRVSNIVEEILRILTEKRLQTESKNRLVAFFSPISRVGKTSLAKMFCEKLGRYIYVSWEGFSCLENQQDMGARFLYCIKSRKEDFDGMLENIANDSVVIDAPMDYRDVRQIDSEDIGWLRENISKGGEGICVVFDIGNTMLGDLNILKEFDCVYMPVFSDEASRKKMEHWDRLASSQWKTTTLPNVHRFDVTNQNLAVVFNNLTKGGPLW